MKMVKKVALTAALVLGASSAFAVDVKASGEFRTEIFNTWDDDSEIGYFSAASSLSGKNLGIGGERLGVEVEISDENAGAILKYEADDGAYISAGDSNIKKAFGYVNLCDKLVTVEAGLIDDRFTGTNGHNGYNFSGSRGARVVAFPVEGLSVSGWVGTNASPATERYTKDLVAFTAAYDTDKFAVQAGYKLAGNAYFGFDLKAVENLTLSIDGKYTDKDIAGMVNEKGEAVAEIQVDAKVDYTINNVKFGTCADFVLTEDNTKTVLYPFVDVDLSDIVTPGLSAGVDVKYIVSDDDTEDGDIFITPEVSYKVGAATLQGFYTFAKNDFSDIAVNAVGLGVKYEF